MGPSPCRLGSLPPAPRGGEPSQPSPRSLRSSSEVSPWPIPLFLFPVTPRFAPAGLWRAKLLSCCRARLWPPDGDLHPRSSSPSPCCLSRKASCSPHATSSSTYRYFTFASLYRIAPGWALEVRNQTPKALDRQLPHGAWGGLACPWELQQVPLLLPGDRVCMDLGDLAAAPRRQNQRGCELRIAEIPKLLGQFHTQAGVWGMLSHCPLGS